MRILVLLVTVGALTWAATHEAAKARTAACHATTVRYLSAKHPTLGDTPWVLAQPGTAAVIGFVVSYAGSMRDRRVNRSDGLVLWRSGGRIVWTLPGPSGRRATVSAERLDGTEVVAVPLTRGAAGLESSPVFPSSGCWRLTLRRGSTEASVVTRVIGRPRAPGCDATPVGRSHRVLARPRSAGIRGDWTWRTSANEALMYTHGVGPRATYAKVAWWVRRDWGTTLELTGIRLDAEGSFRQEFPIARGQFGRQHPAVFPSTVDVPEAGCWLFRLRTGRLAGALVVRAVDLG